MVAGSLPGFPEAPSTYWCNEEHARLWRLRQNEGIEEKES